MQYARSVLLSAVICGALLAAPVWSDVIGPGGKTIDCYCTDKSGARVELGEFRCLFVDGRSFMAQCQMSLNVPMWREVRADCPSASLEETAPAAPLSVLPASLPRL